MSNNIIQMYDKYKKHANISLKKQNYNNAFNSIIYAAKIAYNFNWIFTDDDFENMLKDISYNFKKYKKTDKINNKRVIFYDCFAIINCGLTVQYLNALANFNYDILYIITKPKNEVDSRFINEILLNSKILIKYMPRKNINILEDIKDLVEVIDAYQPCKAFLHMYPWDVIGCTAWCVFSNVERYQINLTDHAYWLGLCCSDYILEFRQYGYNVSKKMRKIPVEKLKIIPFYPTYQCTEFSGLPDDKPTHVKLFSGGSIYKILGNNLKYFYIIKNILIRNPNTIFYYAGLDNNNIMKRFINNNNLNDRWLIIGYRNDIYEIMKNIDIYICSYPINGGLMSQLAASALKPLVSYNDSNLYNFSNIEQFFSITNGIKLSYDNIDDFNNVIDELIVDKRKRIDLGIKVNENMHTKEKFESLLNQCLNKKNYNDYIIKDEVIPVGKIFKLYIDINNYTKEFYRININLICAKLNFMLFIKSFLCIIFYYDKIRLCKKIGNCIKKKTIRTILHSV